MCEHMDNMDMMVNELNYGERVKQTLALEPDGRVQKTQKYLMAETVDEVLRIYGSCGLTPEEHGKIREELFEWCCEHYNPEHENAENIIFYSAYAKTSSLMR